MSRPTRSTKALPAYRLGLLSRTIRKWHDNFVAAPEDWDTADYMVLVFEQLTNALLSLAAEVPPNVYIELRDIFREKLTFWDDVRQNEQAGSLSDEKLRMAAAESTPNLRLLVEQAVPATIPVHCFYQLGEAVGEFQIETHLLFEAKQPVPERLPFGAETIVEIAKTIPHEFLAETTILKALATGSIENAGHARVWLRGLLADSTVAASYDNYANDWDVFVADQLMESLDRAIQSDLAFAVSTEPQRTEDKKLTPQHGPVQVHLNATATGQKPKWDKTSLTLEFGGQVVKTISRRNQATNLICVLTSFEEAGWPPNLEDPLLPIKDAQQLPSQRLHETIRSLNANLRLISFHVVNKGEAIEWRVK